MTDRDEGLDRLLAARFDQEHSHIAHEPFVSATLRSIRTMDQRAARWRIGLRAAALLGLIAISPWLVAGVDRLNAVLDSSLAWTDSLPGTALLGVLAVAALIGFRRLRGH